MVTVTSFEYQPGGKWECAVLNFTAETPVGTVVWEEVVPGPRHGEDAASTTVTVGGKELHQCDSRGSCVLDFPDFEAPNKEGRWAERFREEGLELVRERLEEWLSDEAVLAEVRRQLS